MYITYVIGVIPPSVLFLSPHNYHQAFLCVATVWSYTERSSTTSLFPEGNTWVTAMGNSSFRFGT